MLTSCCMSSSPPAEVLTGAAGRCCSSCKRHSQANNNTKCFALVTRHSMQLGAAAAQSGTQGTRKELRLLVLLLALPVSDPIHGYRAGDSDNPIRLMLCSPAMPPLLYLRFVALSLLPRCPGHQLTAAEMAPQAATPATSCQQNRRVS